MKSPIVIAIVVLVLFGLLGRVVTHGYRCHWTRVGDSQVCQ